MAIAVALAHPEPKGIIEDILDTRLAEIKLDLTYKPLHKGSASNSICRFPANFQKRTIDNSPTKASERQ